MSSPLHWQMTQPYGNAPAYPYTGPTRPHVPLNFPDEETWPTEPDPGGDTPAPAPAPAPTPAPSDPAEPTDPTPPADPEGPPGKATRSPWFETIDNVGRSSGTAIGEVGFLTGLLTRDEQGSVNGLSTAGLVASGIGLTGSAGLLLLAKNLAGTNQIGTALSGVGLALATLAPTTAAIVAAPAAGDVMQGLGVLKKMQDPSTAANRENKNYIEDQNGASKIWRTALGVAAGVVAAVGVVALTKGKTPPPGALDGVKQLSSIGDLLRSRPLANVAVPGVLGGVSAYSIYNLHDGNGDYVRTKTVSRGY